MLILENPLPITACFQSVLFCLYNSNLPMIAVLKFVIIINLQLYKALRRETPASESLLPENNNQKKWIRSWIINQGGMVV